MQPKTEGLEEQGPSGVPFLNDPERPAAGQPEPTDQDTEEEQEDDAS